MESAAYRKLKLIFPDVENIDIMQFGSSGMLDFIPKNLPHISLERIHSLCRSQ